MNGNTVQVVKKAKEVLEPFRKTLEDGTKYVEISNQAEAILALLGKMGRFETGRIFRDLAGRPRVIAARRRDG